MNTGMHNILDDSVRNMQSAALYLESLGHDYATMYGHLSEQSDTDTARMFADALAQGWQA